MRRDQADEAGQLIDLPCRLAQAARIAFGIDPGAGERGAVDYAVEQFRQARQDRLVDRIERAFELAMIDITHGSALAVRA